MSSEFQYPNGAGSLPREDSLNLSGNEDDNDNDHGGDYSTRMEELFADDVQDSNGHLEDESDDEGGFLYTGNDADLSTSYRDQLRNVLEDDSDVEAHEVEKSLMAEDPTEEVLSEDEEHDPLVCFSD